MNDNQILVVHSRGVYNYMGMIWWHSCLSFFCYHAFVKKKKKKKKSKPIHVHFKNPPSDLGPKGANRHKNLHGCQSTCKEYRYRNFSAENGLLEFIEFMKIRYINIH